MTGAAPGSLRWSRLVPAFLYSVGIFYGGVIDVGEIPHVEFVSADKVLHLLAFLGLEMLLELGFSHLSKPRRRLIAVLVSVGTGAALEGVQAALPYRSAEFLDLVADALGAVIGALLLTGVGRWFGASPEAAPRALP